MGSDPGHLPKVPDGHVEMASVDLLGVTIGSEKSICLMELLGKSDVGIIPILDSKDANFW